MGPEISRFLYRLGGGERNRTISWGVATHRNESRFVRWIYDLWPDHFDESLEPEFAGSSDGVNRMVVPITDRDTGPIDVEEVDAFQRRYKGLQVDRDKKKPVTFGNECMGQVLEIEAYTERLAAMVRQLKGDLKRSYKERKVGYAVMVVIGAILGFSIGSV